MEMETNEAENLPDEGKRLEDLADDNLRQIFGDLSVIDRLHLERVSPKLNRKVWELGWSGQKKLNWGIVFEGVSEENRERFSQRFWENSTLDDGSCHLVSLFHHVGENLLELDLASFGVKNIWRFLPAVAESLQLFPKLEKLDIGRVYLDNFVDYLPPTLRVLRTTGQIYVETLEALSIKCPNLEEVPLCSAKYLDVKTMDSFIGKFPRQKTINLLYYRFECRLEEEGGSLASIAQLRELEVAELPDLVGFDEQSFEAMISGCPSLRKLSVEGTCDLPESALLHLAKLPNLTVLEMEYGEAITDSVLKAIAKRGKLKKFKTCHKTDELSDDTIIYLIDRCKSLVSLCLYKCENITDRTLDAILAEVHRRHGVPPRSLPSGPLDAGIFFFDCEETGVDMARAREMAAQTPWLSIEDLNGYTERREII